MPGSGKSSAGILLAKAMGLNFLDTDVVIQAQQGQLLQTLLDTGGMDAFLAIEKTTLLGLSPIATVVATGGSVIYSPEAMAHLGQGGVMVYLETELDELKRRLGNMAERGVAVQPGMGLDELYAQRLPLYEQYADVTVTNTGKTVEETVAEISERVAAVTETA